MIENDFRFSDRVKVKLNTKQLLIVTNFSAISCTLSNGQLQHPTSVHYLEMKYLRSKSNNSPLRMKFQIYLGT